MPASKIQVCEQAENLPGYPFWLIQGKSGRLYSPLSFDRDFNAVKNVIGDLKRLSDALKAQGIQLVIVQVPPTSLVYSEDVNWTHPKLSGMYQPAVGRADFLAAQKTIASAGIPNVNLLNVLRGSNNAFFLYDHHWTAEGSKLAALATARVIRGLPVYKTLTKVALQAVDARTERVPGSYMAALKEACPVPEDAALETVHLYEISRPGLGLLDETAPEIALVGDSYATERFGFGQFLAAALQADVQNASISGGGQNDAMYTYLISQLHKISPPKMLVWNFLGTLNDSTALRTMTAAAMGSCQTPIARGTDSLTLPVGGPRTYLYAEASDKAARKIRFTFFKNGVEIDNVQLEFSDRVNNQGQFYYLIPEETTEVYLMSGKAESLVACAIR